LRGLTSPHDPQARNPDAASVFGDITDAAMKASAQHVLGVSPAHIDAAVAAAGFTPTKAQWLARTIKARRAEIARRAGIPLPDDGVTDAEPDFAAIPDVDVSEPALPTARRISAGIVIVEPDGRLWLIEPKGHHGGYQYTFPKGRLDPGLTTQQNAHREVWEETGLTATIVGYLGDYRGHSGITRYYLGVRAGGTPLPPDPTPYVEGGRETTTVRLVTPTEAAGMLNPGRDQRVLAQVQDAPQAGIPFGTAEGGPGGAGGLVAIGPQGPARRAMSAHAVALYGAGRDLNPSRHPGSPRGPPLARVRLVPARLRPAGAEGVIAFGWKHDELAPDGAVLIFDDLFAEIEAHIAAGGLTVGWWDRLLGHELEFHLLRGEHTGHRHDRHANSIAADLLAARTPGSLSEADRELVAATLRALWDGGRHGGRVVTAWGKRPPGLSVSPRPGQSLLLLPRHVLGERLAALAGDTRAAEITRRLAWFGWVDRDGHPVTVMFDTTAGELDRFGLLRAALDAVHGPGHGHEELARLLAAARAANPELAAVLHALAQARDEVAATGRARAEAYLAAGDEWLAGQGEAARDADVAELAARLAGQAELLRWLAVATAGHQLYRSVAGWYDLGRDKPAWHVDLVALALLAGDATAVPTEHRYAAVLELRAALTELFAEAGSDALELLEAYQRLQAAMNELALRDSPWAEETAIGGIRLALDSELDAARAGGRPDELLELTIRWRQPWQRVLRAHDALVLARGRQAIPGWQEELVTAYRELEDALRAALADPGPITDDTWRLALEGAERLHAVAEAHVRAWAGGEHFASTLESDVDEATRRFEQLRTALRGQPATLARRLWRHDAAVFVLGATQAVLRHERDPHRAVTVLTNQVEAAVRQAREDLLLTAQRALTPEELARQLVRLAVLEYRLETLRSAAKSLAHVPSWASAATADPLNAVNLAQIRQRLLDTTTERHQLLTDAGPTGTPPLDSADINDRLAGYHDAVGPAREAHDQARDAQRRVEDTLRRLSPDDSTDRPGGHGGAVIRGRWRAWQRAWWERLLPLLTRGIQPKYDPTRPRAPPILEIPLTWPVRALLLLTGLGRLPTRLVGHYWADPDVVVVFTPTLTRLREAGLLGRLLAHEYFFHRQANEHEPNELGLTHDQDAAQIIDALDQPRGGHNETTGAGSRTQAASERPGSVTGGGVDEQTAPNDSTASEATLRRPSSDRQPVRARTPRDVNRIWRVVRLIAAVTALTVGFVLAGSRLVLAATPAPSPGAGLSDGSVLLVAGVGAVVVAAVAGWLYGVARQAARRVSAAVTQRVARLAVWGGRLLAGVFAGFVAAHLGGHPLVAGALVWVGVFAAAGDLLLRLVPVDPIRDIGRDWSQRGPPIRLIGLGAAAGALGWLHVSAS
ncbi:MAG: NUDIX domain-containing protein, partial [Actinobacteria bacterium]|nr:NUDIX domain-containing protein [Actinomycetota bacterium]